MLVKPDWDIFKSKFSNETEDYFEWFSYLLFCREFGLEKGWYGFQNQSAIEKSPIVINNEVIGFQSKFYQAKLTDKKDEILKMLETTKRDYPDLTKILFYTNQSWTQAYNKKAQKMVDSKAYKEVFALALSLSIELDWRDTAFFESEFVCLENNDLSQYFFEDSSYQGWMRYGDWSSRRTDLEAEYFIDENIKIISPNHDESKALSIIEGLNDIRDKLSKPSTSIRLVGLSGVGKTRFAQALFDSRIGKNALDVRHVWYCDFGNSPNPIPQHFIEQIAKESKTAIIIVDNCGQELHTSLTKAVDNSQHISLLTIEYDVNFGLPEETSVYRMQPTTSEILKKVLERHYPEIDNINIDKIAEFSGGNYRLALAIASNMDKTDNISVLTDDELFKRLFYQQGELDDEALRVGQIFSLVFSFNIEDTSQEESEINMLADLADVSSKRAYRIIESLRAKDIVQKRGEFRAILPHALANNLAKQAISSLPISELNQLLTHSRERLQTSFLKRISYLHDHNKVKELAKSWLSSKGYFGLKILNEPLTQADYKKICLLIAICPDEILETLNLRSKKDNKFLSISNPQYEMLARLLKSLAYYERNFEQAFWLLFKIVKSDTDGLNNDLLLKPLSSLFHYYLSRSEATLATKKRVIDKLYKVDEYRKYLLDIIDNGLGSQDQTIFIYDMDDNNGLVQSYGYQPQSYGEIWDWFEFLLNKLYLLDDQYPEQSRKIISKNIESIIFKCGRNDEIIKYIKLLHNKKPCPSMLLAIKNFITYRKNIFQEVPDKLDELIELSNYLEPDKQNLSGLIVTYILSGSSWDYKRKTDCDEGYGLRLGGFDSYEDLVEYIASCIDRNIIEEFLKGFLVSTNPEVRHLGYSVIDRYSHINDFISELKLIQHTNSPSYNRFFLAGVSKSLIEKNWVSYTKLIDFLLSVPEFSIIAPRVMTEVSTTKEHYEFIITKITEHPELDFTCLGFDLAFYRHHNHITVETFEYVLDELIHTDKDVIISEVLLKTCLFDKKIDDKYVKKLLELLPIIINTRNYNDYSHAFIFLLNHSKESQKNVFAIIKESINSADYLFNLKNTLLNNILEAMLASNVGDCLDLIYNNSQFKHVLMNRGFNQLLLQANEEDVLHWIGDDQDKIAFWIDNSKLYQNSKEEVIEWLDILNELLSRSSSPENHLARIIESNIFEIFSYCGSYSGALSRRLPILDSLKQYIEQYHNKLTPIIEQRKSEFLKRIERVKEQEAMDSDERQRFEW